MCVGLPGRVIGPSEKSDELVRVEVAGEEHEISIAILAEDVDVGDWLEIHMGHAMAKLSEEDAQEMISFMEELEAAHRRAVEATFGEPPEDDASSDADDGSDGR